MGIDDSCYRANFEDITFERLDGETIAINLSSGHYYSMSGPAADLFQMASSGAPLTMWWADLETLFTSAPNKTHAEEFIRSLEASRLIVFDNSSQEPERVILPNDYQRGEWTMPRLEEFEDLQDLILVDPIHDTSNLGWPHVKEDSD
jgi:hypothetical protein